MRLPTFCMAILVLVLTGCASGIKHKDMVSAIPTLQKEQGRVYFLRSNSMWGAAIQPDIRLDDAVVGESKPGGFFFIDTKPGPHHVRISTETENKLSFVLGSGETKYIKSKVGIGLFVGRVYPELISDDVAQAELPELSYIGSPLGSAPPEKNATSGGPAPVATAGPAH